MRITPVIIAATVLVACSSSEGAGSPGEDAGQSLDAKDGSCLTKAKAAGLCMAGDTGPDCERRVNWFTVS